MGDTAGHVRVLDVSKGIDLSGRIEARQSLEQVRRQVFKCLDLIYASQVAHWKAHDDAVSAVDFVSLEDGGCMLLTCSKDTKVALWTMLGGLVGHFGQDSWRIDDPGTWRDPEGKQQRPPTSNLEDIFTKVEIHPTLTN